MKPSEMHADEAIETIRHMRNVSTERMDELEQEENDRSGGPRKTVLAAIEARRAEGEPPAETTPDAEQPAAAEPEPEVAPAEPVVEPPAPSAVAVTSAAEVLSLEDQARANVRADPAAVYAPGSYGDSAAIQSEIERLQAERTAAAQL